MFNRSQRSTVTALTVLLAILTAIVLSFSGCSNTDQQSAGGHYTYPPARQGDVTDNYHGTIVADPYRWMEDAGSDETVDWVTAQNKLTADFLNTPQRQTFKQLLTDRWDYPRYSLPYKKGNRYFFLKNEGLQAHYVWYMQKTLDSEPEIILDPNSFSEDGTIAVSSTVFSKDGTLLAYALSERGSDWQEFHVCKLDTGEDYDEILYWCKFTGVAWEHDNSGFYYNRYPETTTVAPEDYYNYNRLYRHTLGTPQSQDRLVYEHPDDKELGLSPKITYDGMYLLLNIWHGTDRENRIYYREVDGRRDFVRLLDEADASYNFVHNIGTQFYFKTDLDAPRGRVVAIDIKQPDRVHWDEIIPQQDDVLSSVRVVNNHLVAAYSHDAYHLLKLYDLKGGFIRDIELPTLGSLAGLSGQPDDTELLIGFKSFLYPTSHFRYDFATGEMTLLRRSEVDFDPSQFETSQIFCTSKDGTQVPVFLTYRKGLPLNGNNPTILTGYGGFRVSERPYFSLTYSLWMEQGGVLAVACLRGGNEYGEKWHQAGMLENKQNVFDDFIAAAEWLIENKYTGTPKLAIQGGSNGGLLVAACMVQRPDLFGAVLCGVPVIDMLRYHKYTIGKYWTGEYGNAETDPEHFKFMYAYSPLHNIKPGTSYPPILVTTADTDDRVDPAHSKKFIATLQSSDSGANPILIRVETKAGHGGGKPTEKIIEELSDKFAFLFKVFDMQPEQAL